MRTHFEMSDVPEPKPQREGHTLRIAHQQPAVTA
jgi:hypothetical protein